MTMFRSLIGHPKLRHADDDLQASAVARWPEDMADHMRTTKPTRRSGEDTGQSPGSPIAIDLRGATEGRGHGQQGQHPG